MASASALEHVLGHLSWYIAIFGSFTSSDFLAMVMVAAFRYVLKLARARLQVEAVPPSKVACQ